MDGYGTYKWSKEKFYAGDWARNKMHGKGVF